MILRIALFLGLAVTSAAASDPPGYVVWPKGLGRSGARHNGVCNPANRVGESNESHVRPSRILVGRRKW